MFELSKLDLRILKYLTENGVLESERNIAKALRLSPATLRYKLRKFESNKVIAGHKYRVNYFALGFKRLAWLLIDLKKRSFEIDSLCEELLSYPQVRLICFITGDYDLALKIYSNSVNDLTKFVLILEKQLSQKIEASSTLLVESNLKRHNVYTPDANKKVDLDKTDLQILKLRLQSGGISLKEIAEKIGCHRNTVSSKWSNLLKKRVIIKKSVVISPDYLQTAGSQFKSLVLFDTQVGKKEELIEHLLPMNEVHELSTLVSSHDILLTVRTKNIINFSDFHETLFKDPVFNSTIYKSRSLVVMKSKTNSRSLALDYIDSTLALLEKNNHK